MIRIVLVDDEPFLLEMLENTIPWADYDMKVVGSFYNGRQALDYLKDQEVDAVISDIMMPVMDGMEFLRALKEEGNQCEFVVLSAYNEFELVRSFFRKGAFDYLIKIDIDSDQTKQVLHRLQETIIQKRLSENGEERLLYELRELSQKRKVGNTEHMVLVCLRVISRDMLPGFNECIVEFVQRYNGVCYNGNEGEVVIMLEKNQSIRQEFDEIVSILNVLPYRILAGYSTPGGSERLEALLNEAKMAANYSFYTEETLVAYSSVPNGETKLHAVEDTALDLCKSYIFNHFSETGLYKIKDKVWEVLTVYGEWNIAYPKTIACVEELFLYINGQKKEKGYADAPDEKEKYFFEAIRMADSCRKLKELWGTYMNWLAAEMQQAGTKNLITRIRRYIDANYDKELNLGEIARQFGISENYLSRCFVKENNITFKRYVNVMKIEKAKEYLDNTNLLIGEICERLGYRNVEHFSRLFKEETGFSPSSYRNMSR